MKRREFIAGIGGAATSYLWPRAAGAQQPRKQRIAFVHSGIPADQLTETAGPFWVRQFYETLRGLGYAEGGNLIVERHSAEGRFERFASLAAAVVSRNPDVVLVNQNDFVKAFMAPTACKFSRRRCRRPAKSLTCYREGGASTRARHIAKQDSVWALR